MFTRTTIALSIATALATFQSAYAQGGGLDFVNDTTETILSTVQGIGLAVTTLAVLFAGISFLFFRMDGATALKVIAGGAIIGSAAAIAGAITGL